MQDHHALMLASGLFAVAGSNAPEGSLVGVVSFVLMGLFMMAAGCLAARRR